MYINLTLYLIRDTLKHIKSFPKNILSNQIGASGKKDNLLITYEFYKILFKYLKKSC